MVSETLASEAAQGKKLRLMFQDEARFGRMVRPRRCWARPGCRPMMPNAYQRQFTYVYAAVSAVDGQMEWMLSTQMNTERMSEFLAQVSARYPEDFILMVVDGASSHRAKALVVPPNMKLLTLEAYSPELNPQEHIWDEVREKAFPNRVYEDMEKVISALKSEMQNLCSQPERISSITAWPWIRELKLTERIQNQN